jgi:hypothetical protein
MSSWDYSELYMYIVFIYICICDPIFLFTLSTGYKEHINTPIASLCESLLVPRHVFNGMTFRCDLISSCCNVWVINRTCLSLVLCNDDLLTAYEICM